MALALTFCSPSQQNPSEVLTHKPQKIVHHRFSRLPLHAMPMKSFYSKASFFKKRKRDSTEKMQRGPSFATLISTSDHTSNFQESAADMQRRREMECLLDLKHGCRMANIPVSDNTIFRFAAYYDFDYDLARMAILERFDDPHLHLRMEGQLMQQFESLVVFPLPGLKTKNNKHEVLYFHAARHFPGETDTDLLIKNMCYVFNDMSLTQEQCRNGVAFVVDLNQWTFKNFTNECANKFLKAMQYQVPTKVAAVLIVNSPQWFPKVWRCVLKKMLSESFVKRVHILKHPNHLQDYLMEGYEKYLPMEMAPGWQNSTEIVEDFIDKKLLDESNH